MTTGLLGGTFNPPHNGHVRLAQTAKERFDLDDAAGSGRILGTMGPMASDDAKEGPLAFKEKRAPNFQMK